MHQAATGINDSLELAGGWHHRHLVHSDGTRVSLAVG